MADTIRRGSGPKSGPDKTDPELPATDAPPAKASLLPSILPLPVLAPTAAPPSPPSILNAATLIVNTGDIVIEPASMHEDLTGIRFGGSSGETSRSIPAQVLTQSVNPAVSAGVSRSPTQGAQSTTRAMPGDGALPAFDGERPKVWVATHKAPSDPDPRLILVREPDSARAASFRVMRHRIGERGDPRVIAITSAEPRDGKTTCAANLALALSEFGRAKVLLLEANLRAPQIAVLFGFLPPECFSVQLQRHRERPLDPWSIVEAFSPALHVLAVKPGETNRPLLDAPAFAIAIEMLKRVGYDHIIVDTPPVLGSADVNLIEDYVDAVILTSRSGRTYGRALRSAIQQLSPRKLLGITLLDG